MGQSYGQRQGGKQIEEVSFGLYSELQLVFSMFRWNEELRKHNLKGKRWKQQNK